MGKHVQFYNISIEHLERGRTTNSVMHFFEQLEKKLIADASSIMKEVEGQNVRIFQYYRNPLKSNVIVIPFARPIRGLPYAEDITKKSLKEVDEKLYNVNSLYYDCEEDIALITTDRSGPSYNYIRKYLSRLFNTESQLCFNIEPVLYRTSISDIEQTKEIRNCFIAFDFSSNVNDVILSKSKSSISSLISGLTSMANASKNDLNSNVFKLHLGIGNKKGTMNVNALLFALSQLDMSQEFIKKIDVKYRDKSTNTIELAKLIDNLSLKHYFESNISQVSPEYLLANGEIAIREKKTKFIRQRDEFRNQKQNLSVDYEIQ